MPRVAGHGSRSPVACAVCTPGYRVYFGKDGDTLIILLGGGTKKRQQKDIEAAQEQCVKRPAVISSVCTGCTRAAPIIPVK